MVDEFYTTEPHQFVTPGYGVASSQAWEVEPGNQARYGGVPDTFRANKLSCPSRVFYMYMYLYCLGSVVEHRMWVQIPR